MNENSGFLMEGTQELPGPFRESGGHRLGKGFLPRSPWDRAGPPPSSLASGPEASRAQEKYALSAPPARVPGAVLGSRLPG